MARRRSVDHKKVIARRIKEGRGQGQGKDYKSWLVVQDGPSLGYLCRPLGWTTGRAHHLLSKQERRYLYFLDWSSSVVDIREQYPLLPLERTLEIANRLRIKHPTNQDTNQPEVLTSDFLVDQMTADGIVQKVRTIKPTENLASARVIEKFEIERTFWAESNMDWGIVTEREISQYGALIMNVISIHKRWHYKNLPSQALECLQKIEETLFEHLSKQGISPARAAHQVDDLLGLKTGCSLSVLRHFLARKIWKVDMTIPFVFSQSMQFERSEEGGLYVPSIAS